MAENATSAGVLLGVPAVQQNRIISGMRWTLWLSAVSVPFSYATTILLARTSPDAIGAFGLLGVYVAASLGLLYLGGDAVAIKFIPELDCADRLSFFVSYLFIICLAVLPWIIAAAIWPQKLAYIFGQQSSSSFDLLLVALSPLAIVASLVGAALKGMLEIGFAQLISRLATITTFFVYALFFTFSRQTLVHSYTAVIWGTYLILCAVTVALGFRRLGHLNAWRSNWRSLKFFLPRGFWAYTFSLQQLSALGFFAGRLDVILILNFGSLSLLGKYVAIMTVAESIRVISGYFLGSFLPSLTNLIAARNMTGASSVFRTHMRILFLVSTAATCGLVILARPITVLLGAKYIGLAPLIIWMTLLVGLATPGGAGGTLLSSIGRQQRAVGISLAQIALYLTLFLSLWPRWGLLGAILADGISLVFSNAILLFVAWLSSPFRFSVARDYVVFALVSVVSAFGAHWLVLGIASGSLVFLFAVGLFLLLARYSVKECTDLLSCLVPIRQIYCPSVKELA